MAMATPVVKEVPDKDDPDHPPTTSLARTGSLGRSFPLAASSAPLWGQSSNIPLLSPSELAGASEQEGKANDDSRNENDRLQSLLLAQVRQKLQEEDQPAKKRPRTSTDSSSLESLKSSELTELLRRESRSSELTELLRRESRSSELTELLRRESKSSGLTELLRRESSSVLTASELAAASAFAPSLLHTCSSMTIPGGPASLGGISNLFPPSLGGLSPSVSNNASQIQQLLRQQQMQEMQQLQELKKREEIKRLAQLQSRDAVLQLMLEKQQQQHQNQQQQIMSIDTGNSSLATQLRALQEQDQKAKKTTAAKRASSVDEAAVAKYMRSNSQKNLDAGNGESQHIKVLKALANRGELDKMPPPPPMVSAVSSMDSIAIMSKLLPGNQKNQNQQQLQSSSNRLLGAELSLGGLGATSNLNNALLASMSYPSPLNNLGALGLGGGAASYLGGMNNGLASLIGRPGSNAFCPPVGGPGSSIGLHPSAAGAIYEQRRLAVATEGSNSLRESSVGKPPDAFVDRDPDGRARDLPTLLVVPLDHMQLSSHQTLLRYQIEVFRAGDEDTSTHTRGRNKPVQLGQIGIRCRHCKVLPVSRRKRGSVYFPRAIEGFYQAAQNMNSTHLQTGECPLMGNALRQEFANLIAARGVSTGAGRAYWAKQARKLGLRNTENGIVFDKKEPGSVATADDKRPDNTSSGN